MTDPLDKPLGCSCFRLRRLTRAMSRVYDQHMAAVGLKTTQYSVLANVARSASPVAELAERLGMERTTLTRNLKPLMDAGWVALRPGADSRQRIVTITGAGQEKLAQAYPVWCGAQRAFEQLVGRDAVSAMHNQIDSTLARLTPLLEDLPHAHPE